MTTSRLPRKCARVSAELARQLGKPWPPKSEPEKTKRHAAEHQHFKQTGEKAA